MVGTVLFGCVLVANFRLLFAVNLRYGIDHTLTSHAQNSSAALQSKFAHAGGKAIRSTNAIPPLTKEEADEDIELNDYVLDEADRDDWLTRDAFVRYKENGKTVNATAQHFFFYGSALGLYRDGENPRGDDDVDVAVPVWELPAIRHYMEQLGYQWTEQTSHWGGWGTGPQSLWGYAFNEKGTHVCFGPAGSYYRDAYPVEMLLPVSKIPAPNIKAMKGHLVNIPRKPEEVFPIIYGDSWKTPRSYKGPPQTVFNQRFDENCAVLMKGQRIPY